MAFGDQAYSSGVCFRDLSILHSSGPVNITLPFIRALNTDTRTRARTRAHTHTQRHTRMHMHTHVHTLQQKPWDTACTVQERQGYVNHQVPASPAWGTQCGHLPLFSLVHLCQRYPGVLPHKSLQGTPNPKECLLRCLPMTYCCDHRHSVSLLREGDPASLVQSSQFTARGRSRLQVLLGGAVALFLPEPCCSLPEPGPPCQAPRAQSCLLSTLPGGFPVCATL